MCIRDRTETEPGVWTVSHNIPGLSERGRSGHMYIKAKNSFRPDDFSHEQSLVFEREHDLVLFNSLSLIHIWLSLSDSRR